MKIAMPTAVQITMLRSNHFRNVQVHVCLLRSTDLVHQSQNDDCSFGHVDLRANGFLVVHILVIYMSSIFPLAGGRFPGIVFVLVFKIFWCDSVVLHTCSRRSKTMVIASSQDSTSRARLKMRASMSNAS